MRILMFSTPMLGHVLPMLPLARALRKQGHTVALAAAAQLAGAVESEGFALIPVGPSQEVMVAEAVRRTRGAGVGSPAFVGEYFAGARLDLSVDEALVGTRQWAPHVIVSEHCDYVGQFVATALDLPSAVMAIDPALEPDVLDALAASARSRYLERGIEPPAHAPSGRWLLDLCPPSLRRDGTLPGMEHRALRPEPHQAPEGTPRARRAALTGRPRVLVSFSTSKREPEKLGSLLRSLSTLDVDLVATTSGDASVDGFGLDPDRVELVGFLPAAELLDGVSVVVHHGGSGTTFGAAARGVPAVVAPSTPGQLRQAHRLEASGAGRALPMDEASPEAVTAAVGLVLSDPVYTKEAHRLREEIAAMPSASQVAEELVAAAG
jgi:L-noviosyl transferase